MIQLYKRANAKEGSENNGSNLFVKVDNEYVSLTELKRAAKENGFEPLPHQVENEIEMDGETHNVNDLIGLYKNGKGKKNAEKSGADQMKEKGFVKMKDNEKEDDEKENEVADAKDNPDEVLDKAKKMSSKKNKEDDEDMKENEEEEVEKEKENKKSEEDDVEDQIEKTNKNARKDVKHFIKLNSVRENGMVQDSVTIDTMHNRVDRGKKQYGTVK